MADVNSAPRQITLSVSNLLALISIFGTLVGAIVVTVTVYYTGSVIPQSNDISALKADMANAKAAISQMRTDIQGIHAENSSSNQSLTVSIDQIKELIAQIREKVAALGRR